MKIFNNSFVIENYFTKQSPGQPPKRISADIRTFSDNSRRRFIKKMARINLQLYGAPLFVTLTYQNVYPKNSASLQKQMNLFLTKLRNDNLKYHYVWRLEFQKRGAPHFHLILFPLKESDPNRVYIYKQKILVHWRNSISTWSEDMQKYAVDVQMLKGKKHVFQYISKYATKKDDESACDYRGRRYGFSNNIFVNPLLEVEIQLSDFDLFRKILCHYMKRKQRLDKHYEKYLQHDPTVEVLMSLEEAKTIFEQFQNVNPSPFIVEILLEFSKLNLTA